MLRRPAATRALSALAAAALSGGLAAATGLTAQEQSADPSPELLQQGRALYVENCQPCHGTEGKGDGPAARFLESRPRDLTAGRWVVIDKGTREEIAGVVTDGVDDTDMEPFAEILTAEEIDAIAAYVAAEIAPHEDRDSGS